jgi:hypothetical protein
MSSTSSAESAASPSDLSERGCEPSRSVKSTRSAEESSPSTGPTFLATTISKHSGRLEDLPTLFAGDFLASRSAQPAPGSEAALEMTATSDLEGAGYEVAPPFEIPACAVGHDHRRARFWFLAYADVRSEHGRAFDAEAQVLPRADYDAERVGTTDGIPDRMDRLRMKALGNAVVPQIPEIIGRAIMSASTAHSGR